MANKTPLVFNSGGYPEELQSGDNLLLGSSSGMLKASSGVVSASVLNENGSKIYKSVNSSMVYLDQGRNILDFDGTFETNVSGWSDINANVTSMSSTYAYEGTYSLKTVRRTAYGGSGGIGRRFGTVGNGTGYLKAGFYTLSGYYRCANGSSNLNVMLRNDGTNPYTGGGTSAINLPYTENWTFFSVSIEATTGQLWCWLAYSVTVDYQETYFDCLALTEGTIPSNHQSGIKNSIDGNKLVLEKPVDASGGQFRIYTDANTNQDAVLLIETDGTSKGAYVKTDSTSSDYGGLEGIFNGASSFFVGKRGNSDALNLYVYNGSSWTRCLWSSSDSIVRIPSAYSITTTGTPGDVQVESDGTLKRYASSRKYKKNIEDIKNYVDPTILLKANTYVFEENEKTIKDAVPGVKNIGLIAEELDELGVKGVIHYEDDKPESISYKLLAVYLLEIAKNQEERIRNLEEKINKVLKE